MRWLCENCPPMGNEVLFSFVACLWIQLSGQSSNFFIFFLNHPHTFWSTSGWMKYIAFWEEHIQDGVIFLIK